MWDWHQQFSMTRSQLHIIHYIQGQVLLCTL
jgi:hypothetical protein